MGHSALVTPVRTLNVPIIVAVSAIIIQFSFFSFSSFFPFFSYCFEFNISGMENQTEHQIRENRERLESGHTT